MIDCISLDYVLLLECKFIPLEFIKLNLYYVPTHMFIYVSYVLCLHCMHTFHSAHICMVFNSVKCVHYFDLQVNS